MIISRPHRIHLGLVAVIAAAVTFLAGAGLPQAIAGDRGVTVESTSKGAIDKARNIRGHALIIGNSRYRFISPLSNPANDATDIAAILKNLGFEVTLKVDATHRAMENEVLRFGRKLRKGGVGLFYFAGHGVQVAGRNYLIPIDANVDSESDIKFDTVDAGRILGKMEDAGNGINIIILDACRNNPFVSKFRTENRGLAKMEAPTGSILAYSTAPGSVAADGEGRNGLYTEKLLKYLKKEGLSKEDCFKKVRIEVMEESAKKQVPWESSSLTADFYFISPQRVEALAKNDGPSESVEILYWESIKDSKDIQQYQSYIDDFPDGSFVKLAKIYIKKYSKEKKPVENREKKQPIAKLIPSLDKDSLSKDKPASQINGKYKIAILPSYFGYFHGITGLAGFNQPNEVLRAVNSIEEVDVSYFYRDDKNLDEDKFWERNSIFSEPELNAKSAIQFSKTINVDLALMVRTKYDSGFDIFIYILDLHNSKLLTYSATSVFHDNYLHELEKSVSGSLRNYLNGNMKFFKVRDI